MASLRSNDSHTILPGTKEACQAKPSVDSLLLRQRDANNLLIIASISAAVGEGRVRPDHVAAEGFVGRIEQMGAADLLVTLGGHFREDQVAQIVKEQESVSLVAEFHDENIRGANAFAIAIGFEGGPEPFSGFGLDAAKIPIAVGAVEVITLGKRRPEDAVKARLLRAFPGQFGAWLVRGEMEHLGVIEGAGQEEPFAQLPRRRDGHAHVRVGRFGPVDFARFRIEPVDLFAIPDNELALAAGFIDHWGTIARLLSSQGVPNLLAGVLVESDGGGVFAANDANQLLAVQERMRREAPYRRFDFVFLLEIERPNLLTFLGIQAIEIAFRAKRVDFLVVNNRRCSGSGGIRDRIGTVIFFGPKDSAVGFIEADNAFLARDVAAGKVIGGFFSVGGELTIHEVDATLSHGRAAVARTDLLSPAHLRPALGELVDDAGFAPDAVSLRTEPLRPIVGVR